MLDFMDYVLAAFHTSSRWNVDNSYASLTTTATDLLDFSVPEGIRLHVSSLSSPNFATSYTLGSRGVVDGSLSYLYSSLGLRGVQSKSSRLALQHLVRGYRHLEPLRVPEFSSTLLPGESQRPKDTLLYGRLYLPTSTLEALFLRRIAPHRLLRISCVSSDALPSGGTLLALLSNDYGKYST